MSKTPEHISAYSIPVRRSVFHRDLLLGLPPMPLLILSFVSIIMIFSFQQYYFVAFTAILWFIMRQITKNDEWLLDVFFMALIQPNDYR